MSNPDPKSKPTTSSNSASGNQETISHKLARLDEAIAWFHSDDFSLDQALPKYQAAADLAHEIEHDLAELKNQVSVIADLTKDSAE